MGNFTDLVTCSKPGSGSGVMGSGGVGVTGGTTEVVGVGGVFCDGGTTTFCATEVSGVGIEPVSILLKL